MALNNNTHKPNLQLLYISYRTFIQVSVQIVYDLKLIYNYNLENVKLKLKFTSNQVTINLLRLDHITEHLSELKERL